ncbi:cyclase [Arthrobacter psychrolactophilus]|uniref:Cyclase n=1 Tax=Arthrobacter psychrolactophilus TaxID=92442 RepID=A0A2V5IRN1_9MICC|nr:SRPBCC family protein [Arthrobacter psychrolactophilus]PYI39208.1 cyclase [Arthrobacter psychrolactophilus]
MTVVFECRTRSAIPRAQLFDASRSIDAHTESMAHSHEQAIAGVTSGLISLGEEVTWKAWHFGLPLRMTSRITELDAPHSFTDEQIKGPFRRFKHVHEFSDDPDGTTLMTDRVEFQAPFGLAGRIVERLFLARYLQKLIETRNQYLVEDRSQREA